MPNWNEVLGADPAGLAGCKAEVPPAEKRLINLGEATGGQRGGFLRGVGFGRDGAERAGAPDNRGARVRRRTVVEPATEARNCSAKAQGEHAPGKSEGAPGRAQVGAGEQATDGTGGDHTTKDERELPPGR